MLKLIDKNDAVFNTHQNPDQEALLKCLRVLKQVLNLDAKLGTYDSDSAFFRLLCELCYGNEYIEIEGKHFIPVMKNHKDFWGFIEVMSGSSILTPARIKKAVDAVNDILVSQIQPLSFIQSLDHINYDGKPFSIYIETSSEINGKRIASDIFSEYGFTNFLDLSEWIHSNQKVSLKDLRDLKNTLLFVPETLELDYEHRSLITLFSLLPKEMKGASVVLHSSYPWNSIIKNISSEREFISHFSKRKYTFAKPYKPLDSIN